MADEISSKSKIKLAKDLRKLYGGLVLACIVLEAIFLGVSYRVVSKQLKTEARIHGEEIAAHIQTELHSSFETTEWLKDLYTVYDDKFLGDFKKICSELIKDNLAVGSMYFAPGGIIKHAYPEDVDEATLHFEMLKDPIQGPKAIKAINDRKATIAGPHALIEGGEGFIIRNPIFKDGDFKAFTIIVIQKDLLLKQVSSGLQGYPYHFAIWKEPDPTAILDKDGYILKNIEDASVLDREVKVSFALLNDTWHITLQPEDGWRVWRTMRASIILSAAIFLLLLYLFYLYILALARKRMLENEMEASKAKSSFLFSMSHDIRTPMNAIIGFANLMKKSIDDREKTLDYLEKLHASSNFLLSLINNVLEMARIESGKIKIEENIIDTRLFEHITDSVFEDIAKSKDIKFSNVYELKHDFVLGDEMKIREITLNIIGNAIKYTPAGGFVKLSLNELDCDKPGHTMFKAIAEDSGIGISKDYLPHIFEEFSREHSSTESKVAGSGLGMPIVKKLLDKMNGTIEIDSELGKGTKITIMLPLRLPTEEQIAVATKQNAPNKFSDVTSIAKKLVGKRILLAEDNDLNAEIAISILEEMKLEVEHVANGEECLKKLEQAEAGFFDLILMDIQMPIMNGYETTRAIRNLSDKAKANIPIIAMTANAFAEDRQNAIDAGMNDHVAKPINIQDLAIAISAQL